MRKPGRQSSKLTINAETLRVLDAVELQRVAGGDPRQLAIATDKAVCVVALPITSPME